MIKNVGFQLFFSTLNKNFFLVVLSGSQSTSVFYFGLIVRNLQVIYSI